MTTLTASTVSDATSTISVGDAATTSYGSVTAVTTAATPAVTVGVVTSGYRSSSTSCQVSVSSQVFLPMHRIFQLTILRHYGIGTRSILASFPKTGELFLSSGVSIVQNRVSLGHRATF